MEVHGLFAPKDKAIDVTASRHQATIQRKATERQYFKNHILKNVYFILYNATLSIFLLYEHNFPILKDIESSTENTVSELYLFCQRSEYTNKLCKLFLFSTGQLWYAAFKKSQKGWGWKVPQEVICFNTPARIHTQSRLTSNTSRHLQGLTLHNLSVQPASHPQIKKKKKCFITFRWNLLCCVLTPWVSIDPWTTLLVTGLWLDMLPVVTSSLWAQHFSRFSIHVTDFPSSPFFHSLSVILQQFQKPHQSQGRQYSMFFPCLPSEPFYPRSSLSWWSMTSTQRSHDVCSSLRSSSYAWKEFPGLYTLLSLSDRVIKVRVIDPGFPGCPSCPSWKFEWHLSSSSLWPLLPTDWSKIIEDGLAMTSTSSLSTHGCIAPGLMNFRSSFINILRNLLPGISLLWKHISCEKMLWDINLRSLSLCLDAAF